MSKPLPRKEFDLPLEAYPLTLEAYHPETRKVVWSRVIDAPLSGQRAEIFIPPLRKQLGHPVAMRVIFADGTCREQGPVYEP